MYSNDVSVIVIALEAKRPSRLLVEVATNSFHILSTHLQLTLIQDTADVLSKGMPLRNRLVHSTRYRVTVRD